MTITSEKVIFKHLFYKFTALNASKNENHFLKIFNFKFTGIPLSSFAYTYLSYTEYLSTNQLNIHVNHYIQDMFFKLPNYKGLDFFLFFYKLHIYSVWPKT